MNIFYVLKLLCVPINIMPCNTCYLLEQQHTTIHNTQAYFECNSNRNRISPMSVQYWIYNINTVSTLCNTTTEQEKIRNGTKPEKEYIHCLSFSLSLSLSVDLSFQCLRYSTLTVNNTYLSSNFLKINVKHFR